MTSLKIISLYSWLVLHDHHRQWQQQKRQKMESWVGQVQVCQKQCQCRRWCREPCREISKIKINCYSRVQIDTSPSIWLAFIAGRETTREMSIAMLKRGAQLPGIAKLGVAVIQVDWTKNFNKFLTFIVNTSIFCEKYIDFHFDTPLNTFEMCKIHKFTGKTALLPPMLEGKPTTT